MLLLNSAGYIAAVHPVLRICHVQKDTFIAAQGVAQKCHEAGEFLLYTQNVR